MKYEIHHTDKYYVYQVNSDSTRALVGHADHEDEAREILDVFNDRLVETAQEVLAEVEA